MISYVKLREATELPCVHCSKKETAIFLIEELHNKTKKTHYMCETCFKEFKKQNNDSLKEYFERDLSDLLKS